MNNLLETAVWRRVSGKQEEFSEEDALLQLYAQELAGTYLLLHLANLRPFDAELLRAAAERKTENAAHLSARYFFKTGKKPVAPMPSLPLEEDIPQMLRLCHSGAKECLQKYSRSDEEKELAESAREEIRLLEQIIMRRL